MRIVREWYKDAVSGLATDMVINPQMNGSQMAMAGGGTVSNADLSSLVGAIREAVGGMSGNDGDIVFRRRYNFQRWKGTNSSLSTILLSPLPVSYLIIYRTLQSDT